MGEQDDRQAEMSSPDGFDRLILQEGVSDMLPEGVVEGGPDRSNNKFSDVSCLGG